MIRYFVPLAAVFALASTVHAQTNQTFTRSYITNNPAGGTTTTTISGPATAEGMAAMNIIAGQSLYGTIPTYGANCPPTGYAGYYAPPAGYGYGYGYAPPCPPGGYPYGYPPQSYFVPSQTAYLPHATAGWNTPPALTTPPQVITNPGYPGAYPYGGYAPYNYGWNTRTTVANGGVSFNRGGVSVNLGGGTIIRR